VSLASCVRFDTIPECDGQTTDISAVARNSYNVDKKFGLRLVQCSSQISLNVNESQLLIKDGYKNKTQGQHRPIQSRDR